MKNISKPMCCILPSDSSVVIIAQHEGEAASKVSSKVGGNVLRPALKPTTLNTLCVGKDGVSLATYPIHDCLSNLYVGSYKDGFKW